MFVFAAETTTKTLIERFNIRPLIKQCGMVFRGSENTLLGTGVQPFLVEVNIKGGNCFGTLISPMHVLTLASCFMLESVSFFLEGNCHVCIIYLCILNTRVYVKILSECL